MTESKRQADSDLEQVKCPIDVDLHNSYSTLSRSLDVTPDEGDIGTLALPKGAPSVAPTSQFGRYRLVRVLGEGGFGQVLLGHDDELDRPVAIKIARADRLSYDKEAEAYLTEARLLASLDHPSIVPVYDAGRTADGRFFVVSKYVDGGDLENHLQHKTLSHIDAASIVATIAEAMHYAHDRGIIHRDIKPSNILMTKDGRPKLADFGLALRSPRTSIVAPLAGTARYMSPEQLRGERLDRRSDIYSLGLVLVRLVCGASAGCAIARRDANADMRPTVPFFSPGDIPVVFYYCCRKALAMRAEERFSNAEEFSLELRTWVHKELKQTNEQMASNLAVVHMASKTGATSVSDDNETPSLSGTSWLTRLVSSWTQRDVGPEYVAKSDDWHESHVLHFTIANRTLTSQVLVKIRIDVLAVLPSQGIPTRLLEPIATWRIALPYAEGTFYFDPEQPLLIASNDAAVVEVRFENNHDCGYRLRVGFISDRGQVAVSDFFEIGDHLKSE